MSCWYCENGVPSGGNGWYRTGYVPEQIPALRRKWKDDFTFVECEDGHVYEWCRSRSGDPVYGPPPPPPPPPPTLEFERNEVLYAEFDPEAGF